MTMVYNFNAVEAADGCIEWIKEYARDSGMSKAIIGISGGKDSYVAAALCCKALGNENVIGVMMPNGIQSDIDDAVKTCKLLGIQNYTVNIKEAFNGVINSIGNNNITVSDAAYINIAPRIRMNILYTLGQTLHARVCGTSNLSEVILGYCTKYGDTGCDFNPIRDFTSVEVVAIGDALGLDSNLVHKTPADGLTGKSDEENLGIRYIDVHKFARNTEEIDNNTILKIEQRKNAAKHKFSEIPYYKYF